MAILSHSRYLLSLTERLHLVFMLAKELNQKGLHILCPDIDEQEAFLKRVGIKPIMIPYDSDNRRNVGYLMTLESELDLVISIDDDNYCVDSEDFFAVHSIVLQDQLEAQTISSDSGWYNICELLK